MKWAVDVEKFRALAASLRTTFAVPYINGRYLILALIIILVVVLGWTAWTAAHSRRRRSHG